jgi:hypothetical protein
MILPTFLQLNFASGARVKIDCRVSAKRGERNDPYPPPGNALSICLGFKPWEPSPVLSEASLFIYFYE